MTRIKLPGLVRDDSRHGQVRFYYRQKGHPKIRIEGELGSSEFLANYEAARTGYKPAKPAPQRLSSTTFEYLVRAYFNSKEFKVEIGDAWRNTQRRILEKLLPVLGDKPFASIQQRHVLSWMDARAETPAAANDLLKALKSLFKFAVARELATVNPVEKIKKVKYKTEGFHTWTVEEVRRFEAKHPVGTTARLAMALLLYTGLRRSDVVLLGRQHITRGQFYMKNQKTGMVVDLPILSDLQAVLDASSTGHLTFLMTSFGKPFVAAGFGNAMREWCDAAGLPHCSAHGLRKAGATIAAENGATDRELMAIFGWKRAEQATTYTEKAERRKMAQNGMEKINLGTDGEHEMSHPSSRWDNLTRKVSNNNG
jgi:integrase